MRTLPGRTDHVVVVGAGLSGLSAALHLAGAGRSVTVVERDAGPGGRAGRIELGGYLLDTGPTVLTMPHLIEEAMAAVGEPMSRHIELLALHPAYRAQFADGTHIDVHTDAEAMECEVRRAAGGAEAAGYRRLRRWLERIYRAQMRSFIDANFDSPLGLLTPDLVRLAALGGFATWQGRVARFVRDERLRRIFSFQALYAGVPPTRALAAYAVIAYMDTVAGVHFPRGGMHAVPRGMAAAAQRAGVAFRYGTAVTRVERSAAGRATAVFTDGGERIACDVLVLTCDLPVAHGLLGGAPRRLLPLRHAPSAVVLHVGGPRRWPGLAHHTISFGASWHRTFRELTRTGELMSDPSLLITAPTVTDSSLAPPGRHLHYVLAPCPNLTTGPYNWRAIGPRYRDRLLAVLRGRGLEGFGQDLEMELLVTPADWAAQRLAAGTPFSAAHTFAQTGPFRTGNLPSGWENVVLAGCGTTPGVGVPTVIVSGKLAAARITGRHRPASLPGAASNGQGHGRTRARTEPRQTTGPGSPGAATPGVPGSPAATPNVPATPAAATSARTASGDRSAARGPRTAPAAEGRRP
ncbi:phytoene desaturase family protein [Streptomyces marispadix]|uniref:Phytoene desaturase family protein n=1 Tax=Streptomyces marispadix TaxID=2922868 RepID=A0ABS9SZQ9_9ACTN|nr:phytoene desaturase family protein [Streptomyces marispadix]MCH6161526.1 phytoene desaturase family protein [Streptomyces marispadix]